MDYRASMVVELAALIQIIATVNSPFGGGILPLSLCNNDVQLRIRNRIKYLVNQLAFDTDMIWDRP